MTDAGRGYPVCAGDEGSVNWVEREFVRSRNRGMVMGRHAGQRVGADLAIGRDLKGKVSPALYVAGILFALVDARIACAIYRSIFSSACCG